MNYWLLGAMVLILVFVLDHIWRRKRLGVPGPIGYPIMGSFLEIAQNAERIYDWIIEGEKKYGPVWGLLLGPFKKWVFLLDPESCDYFLKRHFKNYDRGKDRHKQFKDLLGDGIFVSNGAEWKLHRQMAKPLFRTNNLDRLVPIFSAHTKDLLEEFAIAAKKKEPVEMTKAFMQYTMSTFLDLGLGCTDDMMTKKEKLEFAAAFDYMQFETTRRGFNPVWELFVTKKFKESAKYVDDVVYRIIAERKKDDEETLRSKADIFSQFLLAKDEEGKPLTDRYLRDVFMNFLLAGRDTTAALLTWTFFELDRNPHIKQKVIEEIDMAVKEDLPTAEDIHKLEYTKRALTEVLRLHPSVSVDGREAVEDDVLPCGYKIPKGASVLYAPYAMGRSEKLYPDPLRLDPDRWTEANSKNIKPGQFTAFHWGPQTCLGKEMAYVEARVALVAILKKFDLILADDPQKCYQTTLILLPKDGLMMQPVFRK